MPTYGQATFLPRAVASLRRQTRTDWELVIVDDGSLDATPQTIAGLAADERIVHVRLATNHGLGTACNVGLDLARAPLIAYLPSDDVIDAEHLSTLAACFDDPDVFLAWSPARGAPTDGLQLVQVMHRAGTDRWTERDELESDDLDRLFWHRLRGRGRTISTGRVTCEWVRHPRSASPCVARDARRRPEHLPPPVPHRHTTAVGVP